MQQHGSLVGNCAPCVHAGWTFWHPWHRRGAPRLKSHPACTHGAHLSTTARPRPPSNRENAPVGQVSMPETSSRAYARDEVSGRAQPLTSAPTVPMARRGGSDAFPDMRPPAWQCPSPPPLAFESSLVEVVTEPPTHHLAHCPRGAHKGTRAARLIMLAPRMVSLTRFLAALVLARNSERNA